MFDIMRNDMVGNKHYVLGWISLRICGETDALLGMQRYAPSCFIELSLVGSPAAESVVALLQTKAINAGGILHWGQANDQLTYLSLEKIYGAQTLAAWRNVRQHVVGQGQGSVFDNNFTARCGL